MTITQIIELVRTLADVIQADDDQRTLVYGTGYRTNAGLLVNRIVEELYKLQPRPYSQPKTPSNAKSREYPPEPARYDGFVKRLRPGSQSSSAAFVDAVQHDTLVKALRTRIEELETAIAWVDLEPQEIPPHKRPLTCCANARLSPGYKHREGCPVVLLCGGL